MRDSTVMAILVAWTRDLTRTLQQGARTLQRHIQRRTLGLSLSLSFSFSLCVKTRLQSMTVCGLSACGLLP